MRIEDTVWLMVGISGSEMGRLQLSEKNFSFLGENGTRFDVSPETIAAVKFPWHYFGGGMKVIIGSETYRFSFMQPHNEYASISDGRATGAKWKAALKKVIRKTA